MPADWHRNSKINRWRKKENRDEDSILYYCDKHIKNRRSYKGLGSRHFPSDGIFTALYFASRINFMECVRPYFCLQNYNFSINPQGEGRKSFSSRGYREASARHGIPWRVWFYIILNSSRSAVVSTILYISMTASPYLIQSSSLI